MHCNRSSIRFWPSAVIASDFDEDLPGEITDYALTVPVHQLDTLEAFVPVLDGFPWIDTGSLGLYHSGLVDPSAAADPAAAEPVPAEDLAAYAAEDLPPGADPWAALADSEDPATSTLARWWTPES